MEMNNFEISDSISSPVVALEQLASELAQERARCTQALRDRARQKVVIEKLLQNQGLLQSQLRQLKEQLAASMEQAEHGSFEQSQQGYQLAAHVRELAQTKRELEEASNEVAKLRIANQEQRDLLSSLSVELNGLRSQLEAEQDRSRSLEAAAETLRKDLDRARAGRAEADGSVTGLTSKIYEQMKEINDLKTKSRLADAISDKYAALMQDDAEIRDRLEESLKRNHSFAQEVRDLSEKSVEKDLEIASLREQLERQSREAEVMLEDLEEARRAQTELSLQADALRSSAASEKARVESMTRSHEYFQSHIAELRDAHTTSLQKYTALEIEYSKAQSKISSLNVEITETKNQLAQLEVFSKEAESAAALALEVERLSSELSDVRRQLVRRDLDEEAAVALLQRQQSVGGDMGSCELGTSGLLSVKLLSEREKHSKQVRSRFLHSEPCLE
jgi:chromosome segregation ATPase